jgi:hypothetical protein
MTMSFLNTLRDYAQSRSARLSRLHAYLRVAELPSDIRKDIGWPDGDGFGDEIRLRRKRAGVSSTH